MNDQDHDPRSRTVTADEPTAEELLALLRQERADFQNYRRRVADERAADADRARGQILESIFAVLDDLDRAFAETPADLASHPWAQGIGMMRARLKETMARLGLETVGSVGEPFDPTRHEAILYETDPEAADQTVSLVIRPGYRVDGRLLRPAEVVVRGPRPTPTTAVETDIDKRPDDPRQPAPATPGDPTSTSEMEAESWPR